MNELPISCPHCNSEFKLTQSLAAPMLAQQRRHAEEQLLQQQQAHQQELERERTRIAQAEKLRHEQQFQHQTQAAHEQLAQLQHQLQHQERKLQEAQAAQTLALQEQRKITEERREIQLTIEKGVQENLAQVRQKAQREAEEMQRLKTLESEELVASLTKKLGDMQRRIDQGSQQTQGEILELDLEARLKQVFPFDLIEPVSKGENGADIRQSVRGASGQLCGCILWEIKRTKNWNAEWLDKLRVDVRRDRADIGVLASQVLPKDIEQFAPEDGGLWVTALSHALALAGALRQGIIQTHSAKQLASNQGTQQELVYQYLTGSRFKQRVESLVESYGSLQEDLNKERAAMLKIWAKRQTQIDKMLNATTGMYGDLQGLAGSALHSIAGMELAALDWQDARPTTE